VSPEQSTERQMSREVSTEITRAPITATVIGLVVGLFSGFLGVGGGLIMVPALIFLLRLGPQRAHGTSLAVVLPMAVAGVSGYASHGSVHWPVALLLALGSVFGALLGAVAAARVKRALFKRALGVMVVLTGIAMMLAPSGGGLAQHWSLGAGVASPWTWVVLVGLVAGALSGLVGVGGGLFTVPAALFLLGLPEKMAQGISLAVIVPVSTSVALIHYLKGNVVPGLVGWLSCGAVVGAIVSSHRVGRIEDETLQLCFGIFLIAVGVSTASRRLRSDEAPQG
jgi:uncharacterized protein